MKKYIFIVIVFIILIVLIGVGFMLFWNRENKQNLEDNTNNIIKSNINNVTNLEYVNGNTTIEEVINDKDFEGFGNLIFPVDLDIDPKTSLKDVGSYYMWYNYINPDKTVEIINYLKEQTENGNQVFYDIYTEEERKQDPEKENTGIFFFRGNPGEKVAIGNAGGGFYYVGALHDSFPHCLELSKRGINSFALIYRPDAQKAPEDLARAIAFIHENQEKLQVNMENYSLWGGSAGGRMANWVGTYGTAYFGEKEYPKPSALIIQYTGLSEVTGNEPPTYNCVGTKDGIASYRTMQDRINKIKSNGTDAEIEIFDSLPHGFGLGEGTVAEGWIDNAISFWERQINNKI